MSDTPSDPQNDNPPPTDENSQTPSAGNLAGELTGLARAMKDLQLPAALVFAVVVRPHRDRADYDFRRV